MKKTASSLIVASVLFFASWAAAQEIGNRIIKNVGVTGLLQVSEQKVRSQIEVQPGQTYAPRSVGRDLRRLYETGHFTSIKVDAVPEADGIALTYIFEEKRVIDQVKILGNKKVKARAIRGVLTWREGDTFVQEGYDGERDAILKLYASKGFPNASVDINVEEVAPNRLRVVYTIKEGSKARIRSITFAGNDTLSAHKLKKVMKTKHAWWFLGGKYDADTFEADLQSIVNEYGNHGRLEAEIAKTDFNYFGKSVDILINVAEGPEYRVESLNSSNNKVFDKDEIEELLKVHGGDVHNKGQVQKDAELVAKGYQDSGYVNANVEPQVTLDREKKTTHIVHNVTEGDLKYIKEIDITGNSVTRDNIIRREVLSSPGERFDGSLLRASQQRLENSEYFEKVRLTLDNIEFDEKFANVLLDVDEGKTGLFNFGGGYSTEDGVGGFVELQLKNFDITNWPTFSGGGQQLRIKAQLSQKRNTYNLSFTDPEIGGLPLAFGFDVFNETTNEDVYKEDSKGGQLRVAKQLSPYVTARTALRYNDVDIYDIPYYSSWWVDRERGGRVTVSTIWGINRNTRDSNRDPSKGSVHDLQLEVAGLGGDNDFVKLEHDSSWYRALDTNKKWILSFRTREGWADAYGSSSYVPISYRFFAGGSNTMRGYKDRDVGPREPRDIFSHKMDPTGGDLLFVNNLELKYKLTDRLRLYTFVDAGGVWANTGDFDFGDVRYSTGLGLGFDIPRMGPIRVDYGIPLNPEKDQGHGQLHLLGGVRW